MTTDADPLEASPEAPPKELGSLDPGELVARALQTPRPTGGQGSWVPPAPEELARLLPQYHIERLLGHGGMGAVYQGEQPALQRRVAIKLLPAELAQDAQFVARFLREARMLARLQHPGIVAVHDCGQSSAGHLYFVMEYVEGTDLQRVLRDPGLNPDQALELITQICDALHYAHRQGVIHRDIKPANILVGVDGRVKVADFGLARPHEPEEENLTQTNMVMGTPAYMAPEQRMGHADQRADIFALGVMLYEMLTGGRPHGAFDPPSHKVQVDVRIDRVVLKALQSEPERRYQQVSEMRGDVENIRTTPLPAKPPVAPVPPPGRVIPPPPERGAPPAAASRAVQRPVAVAVGLLVPALLLAAWFLFPRTKAGQGLAARPAEISGASHEKPFVNTLRMEFVPVPDTDLLFCTTVTRVRDFRAFAEATNFGTPEAMAFDMETSGTKHGGSWKNPGFPQDDDHPVVCVNYEDAERFCQWLSKREGHTYRLPTDHEWSCAAGLGQREDARKPPGEKSMDVPALYAWGTRWPPPPNAGNFADAAFAEHFAGMLKPGFEVLRDYSDGYIGTAPVKRFDPSSYGLYDMSGNVCQICADRRLPQTFGWAVRGGCFTDGGGRLLLSYRRGANDLRVPIYGFRCVLEPAAPLPRREPRKPS